MTPTVPTRRPLGRDGLALLLGALALVAFFRWTVFPEGGTWRQWGHAEEYYNSEIRGFQSGHLWMATEPAAKMQALADPYDPVQNAPYRLHDASYFHGHYYLYFGVNPAIAFFWPVAALTGHYASEAQGVLFFCTVGYLVSLALLWAVRRRYFPQASVAVLFACAVALGLATMVPTLLRRPAIYEVPIAFAYAGGLVTLALLWVALHAECRAAFWTAGASLAFGLTVGARPTYALGGLLLLLPIWQKLREPGPGRRRLPSRGLVLATLVPVAAVAVGLMAYNFGRFGRVLEFGQSYQLSGAREGTLSHFSLRYLPFNLRVYLLTPARLSAYFPYVTIIDPPTIPPGQFGLEDPFGILPDLPFVVLAFLAPLAVRGRPRLRRWAGAAGWLGCAAAAPLFIFGGACSRYMVDFLPAWVVLATLGVLALEAQPRAGWRRAGRLVWISALVWSALFGLLASIQHNDLLRINHPGIYAPLARAGNWPADAWDRVRGTRYGPLELTLKFPTDRTGQLEPLLVNGAGFKSDYLYVLYADPRYVIFGFEHTGYGGPLTERVAVDLQQPHRLVLDGEAFYPPEGDAFFDSWTPAQVDAHVHRLRVSLDGVPLMDDPVQWYDPVARTPWIGLSPDPAPLGRRFTGTISGAHRVEGVAPDPFGAVRLYLELPAAATGQSEPLLTTGVTGKGDLIRIVYVDGSHIRLVHDRWGFGGASSAAIPVRYDGRHQIELSLGSLYPDGPWTAAVPPASLARLRARWVVKLDGAVVLDLPEASHPAAADTVAIGTNAIGASLTAPRFTGRILNQQRTWDP